MKNKHLAIYIHDEVERSTQFRVAVMRRIDDQERKNEDLQNQLDEARGTISTLESEVTHLWSRIRDLERNLGAF